MPYLFLCDEVKHIEPQLFMNKTMHQAASVINQIFECTHTWYTHHAPCTRTQKVNTQGLLSIDVISHFFLSDNEIIINKVTGL